MLIITDYNIGFQNKVCVCVCAKGGEKEKGEIMEKIAEKSYGLWIMDSEHKLFTKMRWKRKTIIYPYIYTYVFTNV